MQLLFAGFTFDIKLSSRPMYKYLLFWCLLVPGILHPQPASINIRLTCMGKKAEAGDTLAGGIVLHQARLYLSDFRFTRQGREIYREPDSYHLFDFEELESGKWTLDVPEFDGISFRMGIDSTTNVSGAYGGDLDPTRGMYWTWNSGYINVKLEGYAPLSKGRNGEFALHLGGYMPPFQTSYQICTPINVTRYICIDLDVCPLFEQIDWRQHSNVMSPSAESLKMMTILGKSTHVYGR